MAIRFRFRNAREVHSVPVTGSGISLKDLKSAIISQRGLGDDRRPVDLLVFDARSRIRETLAIGRRVSSGARGCRLGAAVGVRVCALTLL